MSLLDAPVFPLEDPAARSLMSILVDAYDDTNDVKLVIKSIGMKTTDISWTNVGDVWPDVLERAAKAKLLRKLVQFALEDQTIAGFHQRLGELVAACDDEDAASLDEPQDHCLVDLIGRRPFMNRSDLRTNLRNFLGNYGDQVMIVDGPPSSGRSYSWFLIWYVGEKTGSFKSYLIDMTKWSDTAARPGDVARLIASELGWEQPEFDQTAQDETTSRILLSWLKGRAKDHQRPVCLVFDGLDRPNVAEATLGFIGDIATAAGNAELGTFRVVLLAFGRSLADQNVDPYVLREPLKEMPLVEVKEFFQRVAKQGGTKLSTEQIDQLLATMLGAPPPDPIPIKLFGVTASEVAFKLSRGSDG